MATLIAWDGKETEVRPAIPERGFSREELSKLLEGPVEFISLADGRLMAAGFYSARSPVNIKATKLVVESGRPTGVAVVGSVIVGCPGEIS